jgi:NAD+ kinase
MTEVTVEEAEKKIPDYISGKHRVEQRMMLQAAVVTGSDRVSRMEVHALNDVVVSRGAVPQLLDIGVTIDGAPLVTYRADGVIAATATGSTGYALSAGAPIFFPEALMMMLQPVAAHTGLRDGLVLPHDTEIVLAATDGKHASLSVDGMEDVDLAPEYRVTIRRSPHEALFLRSNPRTGFYTSLTRRLGLVYNLTPPT